jgi:chaperonin GroES
MAKQAQKALLIEPLSDRVLLSEIDEKTTKTASGIYLPESHNSSKGLKKAKVIAVGKGKFDDGVLVPMTIKKGDVVLYSWGDQVEIEGKEYYITKESEISAIISK